MVPPLLSAFRRRDEGRQNKAPRHSDAAPLRAGDPSTYESDNPWWTLRFAAPVTEAQQRAIGDVFAGSELHLAAPM
jgi:hypothetical protein